MILETERLILKPLSESDFENFVRTDTDPEVMKFIRKASANSEEARVFFNRHLNYIKQNPGYGAFTVTEKSSGEFLGLGFIINIELKPENPDIEVGYRLLTSSAGRGIATEVAKCLIAYGFNTLKLKTIYGTTHPDHVVSQKILMKVGMSDEGVAPYYSGTRIFKVTVPAPG
jgi:ribosomal-protein-alanine N-acetyltransferase